MPIVLVNLPVDAVQSISAFVTSKRYTSLEEFVLLAITNQLTYEKGTGSGLSNDANPNLHDHNTSQGRTETTQAVSVRSLHNGLYVARSHPDVAVLECPLPKDELLWGQYYRFLPLKVVLRLLENTSTNAWPELHAFHEIVAKRVQELGGKLRALDEIGLQSRDGVKLSVGFPNARKPEKSTSRYIEQYVGTVNRQHVPYGFGPTIGFIGIQTATNECYIGLTEAGRQFATTPNPVLDHDDYSASLGPDEVHFLIHHICNQIPAEKRHIGATLTAIAEGHDTPDELDQILGQQYRGWFPAQTWSSKKITAMRSGVLSRLREMGIVRPKRKGIRVRYDLDNDWNEVAAPCLNKMDDLGPKAQDYRRELPP